MTGTGADGGGCYRHPGGIARVWFGLSAWMAVIGAWLVVDTPSPGGLLVGLAFGLFVPAWALARSFGTVEVCLDVGDDDRPTVADPVTETRLWGWGSGGRVGR